MVKIIGQKALKEKLSIIIGAAKKEKFGVFRPILLTGPAGYGKTTFAEYIAELIDQDFFPLNGVAINDMTTFAKTIYELDANLKMLFIDEVHSLAPDCQELLYTVIENNTLTNPKRGISVDIDPINIVAATTDEGKLLPPMYSRFVYKLKIENYSLEELAEIASTRFPRLRGISTNIAKAGRGCPRTVVSLSTWVNDYCVAKSTNPSETVFQSALSLMQLNKSGLSLKDIEYMTSIYKNGNNPLGLKTLCSYVSDSEYNIEHIIEPFLLKQQLIQKTPRGRILTAKAIDMLKKYGQKNE